MLETLARFKLVLLPLLLVSSGALASGFPCSGCRTLEDAARVGSGFLWSESNGLAGIYLMGRDANEVRLFNTALGVSYSVRLSMGFTQVPLGRFGTFPFPSVYSREVTVLDSFGNRLRQQYTVQELELNASLWLMASHIGYQHAVATYDEVTGWQVSATPYTEFSLVDGGPGLTLSFERHYSYQPNVVTTITECGAANCGLATQSRAQAPGGALIVPVPLEEPKNRER